MLIGYSLRQTGTVVPIDELSRLTGYGDIVESQRLAGGSHGSTWLATRADGSQVVVKAGGHLPDGLFPAEAEGLGAIAATKTLSTPKVLDVGPHHLVLEVLSAPPATPAFWEAAGRAVAALHSNTGPAHGWHRDNWLGQLPQHNGWCLDGHEFFAQHRILRYLDEPPVQAVLGVEVLRGIERICSRLSVLVPVTPPVLCHGDLWSGNFLSTLDGRPAVGDPAVAYTWAELDISMMYCEQRPDERFFDAYLEVHRLEQGWKERMELLHLRELLSVLAHFGAYPELCAKTVRRVQGILAGFC